MQVQQQIQDQLQALQPQYMELLNESHTHAVPPNSETHFKLVLVSEQFQGMRKVARHQAVYKLLAEQLSGPVHALALHLYTPQEWSEKGVAPESPNCMGGGK